ncbi:MAG: ADOP family duplicated permease [Gemmatimonadaceae bacterium]
MSVGPGWRRMLRLSFGKRSLERDVDDELAFHLSMREDKLRRLGLTPDAARAEAQERFGDAGRVREECLVVDQQHHREVRMREWVESLWADFRFALRMLRRMPAFTAVATITLALGIGATTAMFTLVNGILLRPLPYPDADRLVRIIQSYPEKGLDTWGLNQQNIAMYRDRATNFVAFAGYRAGDVTMRAGDRPERLTVLRVTADFFRVIGVGPAIGRPFTADEDTPGKNTALILSHGTWQTRFGANPSVVGTTVEVDGQPFHIVGVMPPGFAFPRPDVDAWVPMGLDPLRRFGYLNSGLGRLKPGVTPERAERQTTAIMWDWARQERVVAGESGDPSTTRMKTIVRPLHEVVTSRSARPLTVLLAAVTLILLIATANVAMLLSGRASARQREINLRTALGATGGRVVRQLLTESVALALLGAVAGVSLAVVAVRAFAHSTLAALPRIDEVSIDGRVLAFTLAVSVASGLAFGLLPALHAARGRLTGDLIAGQREGARGPSRRINDALVVAQLSLSVVLLIAAGLVLKSFQRLTQLDLGFRPEGVTSIALALPSRLGDAAALRAFVNTTLERVRAVPGVQSASLAWAMPMEDGANYDGYLIEGRPVPPSGNEEQTFQIAVSPDHFKTVGIPLLVGRDFAATDDSTSRNVGIVDETLASRYWRGAEALGKRIRVTGDTAWFTIVGVVGAVREGDATMPPRSHLYVSIPQVGGNRLSLAVRAGGSAAAIAGVRRAIADVEPSIPLDDVRSLSGIVDQTFATRRLTKILLGGFALVGLILAAVGIYGVMSLSVANRGREFGIRLAVGADPRALVRLVLVEGAALAGLGVVLGIAGAVAVTRWLASLLYEVSPTDPAVLVALPLGLAAVALAACYVPARRAARSDPSTVLRVD